MLDFIKNPNPTESYICPFSFLNTSWGQQSIACRLVLCHRVCAETREKKACCVRPDKFSVELCCAPLQGCQHLKPRTICKYTAGQACDAVGNQIAMPRLNTRSAQAPVGATAHACKYTSEHIVFVAQLFTLPMFTWDK